MGHSPYLSDGIFYRRNVHKVVGTYIVEQPWPSSNALDSDQRGPGFEAHRMPLVTSGRHTVLNARARTKVLSEAPSKPQGIGGNGSKIEYRVRTYIVFAVDVRFLDFLMITKKGFDSTFDFYWCLVALIDVHSEFWFV